MAGITCSQPRKNIVL